MTVIASTISKHFHDVGVGKNEGCVNYKINGGLVPNLENGQIGSV
jgi:hypothetical protein